MIVGGGTVCWLVRWVGERERVKAFMYFFPLSSNSFSLLVV